MNVCPQCLGPLQEWRADFYLSSIITNRVEEALIEALGTSPIWVCEGFCVHWEIPTGVL